MRSTGSSERQAPAKPHAVNDLLHNLRGEQFRHAQNLRGSRSHLTSRHIFNAPTLPFTTLSLSDLDNDNFFGSADPILPAGEEDNTGISTASTNSNNEGKGAFEFLGPAGPGPPKSWQLLKSIQDPRTTSQWRIKALSIIIPELSSQFSSIPPGPSTHPQIPHISPSPIPTSTSNIPSLSILCLRFLVEYPVSTFTEDIIPYLNPHLRNTLVRLMAITSPLSNSRLFPLLEPDGHANGELIVIGPQASLKDDYFLQRTTGTGPVQSNNGTAIAVGIPEDENWDSDEDNTILRTFILISTNLAASTLLSLPPTITHLGLIDLPSPISLHRLPSICPLLIVLDLSYNTWLSSASKENTKHLDRIDWSRWHSLRMLGWRGCFLPDGILARVNKGRWDDVEVVR
ncbi:hypothetical protein BDN72DRAFT_891385 [Pluteus cervinus]|uniref:Uncharacterized protein n=1 Tax=Pluteus cervinus TaxID=181527 RepID=A0ACD3BF70_9AGAR|nr:hypothetical protein BDN72DRAFT_891385 [Pluteus cervinus]